MRSIVLIIVTAFAFAPPAFAHHEESELGGFTLRGEFNLGGGGFHLRVGFGGHGPGGFDSLGGLFGWGDVDLVQMRFEDRLEDIKSDYDDGLESITNFYSSDEYSVIVDDTENLVDRYDRFVSRVELSIDRIDSVVEHANGKITFLDDLLTKYQDHDDLSETRLERIEDWITTLEDSLSLKIDLLTEQQTTLSDNLATYQTFQTDLAGYLNGIVAAGGDSMDDGDGSAAALRATSAGDAAASCTSAEAGSAGAVPEPSAVVIATVVTAILAARRRDSDRQA